MSVPLLGTQPVISFSATLTLIGGYSPKNLRQYAVLYLVGITLTIATGFFMMGPKTMCRRMWHRTRRCATAMYFSMLILTFSLALGGAPLPLVFLSFFAQFFAGIWYTASWFPRGRQQVVWCCKAFGPFYACPEACKPIEAGLPTV